MPKLVRPRRVIEDYETPFRLPSDARRSQIEEYLRNPVEVPEASVVFGHFFPIKYLGINNPTTDDISLITFLRDPIDRLFSHYSYWQANDNSGHYLWRKMKSENWSFMDFALSNEMRNFYSQYLEGVRLDRITFIGIHESMDVSWKRLRHVFGSANLKLPRKNTSKSRANYDQMISPQQVSQIREFHHADYRIYDTAYARLQER
jgi:hypothetical protein